MLGPPELTVRLLGTIRTRLTERFERGRRPNINWVLTKYLKVFQNGVNSI